MQAIHITTSSISILKQVNSDDQPQQSAPPLLHSIPTPQLELGCGHLIVIFAPSFQCHPTTHLYQAISTPPEILVSAKGHRHRFRLIQVLIPMPLIPVVAVTRTDDLKSSSSRWSLILTLETHLSIRTFLVGDRITSADITAASIPQHIVSVISDAAVRAKLINTVRFLETIVHQPKRRTFLVGDRITPADNTDAYI
ncbi:hypothetical protein P692DRAFT_201863478 [Suillus brevipes Sb2]|nr:hypothetical protein P692DRAFT_201863478 [Suillus brevipes Sb2]